MLPPLTRQHAHTIDGGKRALASHPRIDPVRILAAVKNTERERTQLRGALKKIQAVLAEALA